MALVAGAQPDIADLLAILAATSQKPVTRVLQSAAQTGIPNNTPTAITFDAETLDTHGFHSTSVNNSRITPTRPGIYLFKGTVFWQARADWQLVYCYIRQNGSVQIPPGGRNPGTTQGYAHAVDCEVRIPMNGTTDYIELIGQASTSTVQTHSTVFGGAQISVLECEFIRDL